MNGCPLNLTELETGAIIRHIDMQLWRYANEYDERKNPPAELARLRALFATPDSVSERDILAALLWKYGHTLKRNYPHGHRELASRIARLWPDNSMRSTQDPRSDFLKWRNLLPPTSFVTICFLLHLVHGSLPILDQHNYRSVNAHLVDVRPRFPMKPTPRQFEDLLLVRDFGIAVLSWWERHSDSVRPTADILDRYLMMHGKWLKSSRH